MFAVLNKSLYDVASPHHPLLTTGPHDCFPLLVLDNMLGNHDHNRPVTSLDHDHDDRDGGDGFWKASLEMPERVLLLKYEDLRKEPSANVKRLAEFSGQPFSDEDESKGLMQQIIKLCSFENLSCLEVNKTSKTQRYFIKANLVIENSDFFRKGQVGDWKNFFTDDMAKRMDHIIDERISGSGLTFANP
ncbi:hypothetical protein EV1_038327 [Malus domestica]